jgi:hypothetical protein
MFEQWSALQISPGYIMQILGRDKSNKIFIIIHTKKYQSFCLDDMKESVSVLFKNSSVLISLTYCSQIWWPEADIINAY